MRPTLLSILMISLLLSASAQAQDTRYISDKQFVPLRSGGGNEYRIVHRGLPSGTKLTVSSTSGDGVWAQITTDRGTKGWVRTQYLMEEVPAQLKLDGALQRAERAVQSSGDLKTEVEALKAERTTLIEQVSSTDSELGGISEELSRLKQISGNAVQLDVDNRRLLKESEDLRSDVETLESENQRLQDKLESEDFLNGALAVLLGVIITLVVPRLWPKRRKSSSWA